MAKKTKPKKMAEELEQLGENWAYVVRAGTVVLIGPGEAFKGSPMMTYDENALNEAVGQGLLQKKTGRSKTIQANHGLSKSMFCHEPCRARKVPKRIGRRRWRIDMQMER